ncbi:ABC transporter substrate-binding protein [Leeia oryzae]|uniref:ABC transporter substrate-binding protein n=1 Tax=Leeia oryzae TaxID=356662 RepID=UPI00035E5AA1|nr:ABC transporter substrate-binding protein [Leeia oryzae]
MPYSRITAGLMLLGMISSAQAAALKHIGVSLSDLGNPFFVRIAEGVEETAHRIAGPSVKVTVVSSAYDLQRQIAQMEDFITRKVDLIVLNAADPVAIEPVVGRARDAGIKVVAVDVNATGADVTITTDNLKAGQMSCQALADKLGGKGNVVILNGPPVSSVIDRVRGCKQILGKYPGIRLLSQDKNGGGSREGGIAKMTEILSTYANIQGLFTINDPTAIGAEEAIIQTRRKRMIIMSIDGAPSIEARLKDPTSMIEGSATQSPDKMAQLAVEVGYQMINGKPPKQTTILIPPVWITKQNVKQYKGWGSGAKY